MNISDSKCDLLPQLLLVKLHPDYFVGESLVEEPVDLGSSTELHGVDSSTATALYSSLEILLELLDHLQHGFGLDARVVRLEIFILFNLHTYNESLVLMLNSKRLNLPPSQGSTSVSAVCPEGKEASL